MSSTLSNFANPLSFFQLLYKLSTEPKRLVAALICLWIHGKLIGKPICTQSKGKVVFTFPLFVYDVIARISWPMNYLINMSPQFQPLRPNWEDDPLYSVKALQSGETGDSLATKEELDEMTKEIIQGMNKRLDEVKVVQLFDTLKPATPDVLIGKTWDGRVVHTSSVLDLADLFIVKPLQFLGFGWGKRYRSRNVGDPLLVNWRKMVYFPLPAWGNVSMMNINFRGLDQATMRYCHQPWNDHFRVLDDGSQSGKIVMLGVWCAREKNGGWFTLTHDPTVVTPEA